MKGHKRERDPGRWELIVDAGRDPVTGRRRQRSRVFRGTSSAADTALAQLVAEVTAEQSGPGSDAPLTTLIGAWLDMVEADLSPTTVQGYRRILRNQIAPSFGDLRIDKITTPDLDAFYRRLLKGLAPATVRQTHSVIRRAFRQAIRWGWLSTNPAAEATPPRVPRSDPSVPRTEQVQKLIAAAAIKHPASAVLYRVAADTGARRGELAGLRESRVDIKARSVLIDRAVVEVGGSYVEKETKGKRARRVAIAPGTAAALRRHMLEARQRAMSAGVRRAVDPYLFSEHLDGSMPLRPNVISDRFRVLAAVHAPGVRLHDLRHYTATTLLAAGVPVKTVSARLGHSSAAMTLDVYAHALEPADRAAADLLGGLLDD